MVVQVGLNREPAVALRRTAETRRQFGFAAIRDVRDPPGDSQTRDWPRGTVIVPALPSGVSPDRVQLGRGPSDLIGRRCRRTRQQKQGRHPGGVHHAPLKRPHPTHRPAKYRSPRRNSQSVSEKRLGSNLIPHGQRRKPAPPSLPVRRCRRGAGASLASAEHIRDHNEVLIRVHRLAWAYEAFPPAWLARSSDVAVTRQGMQYQDRG